MFEFVNFAADKAQIFLLVLMRASGLFLIAPVLSHRSIPPTAKIGLVIILSLIVMSIFSQASVPVTNSLGELLALVAKELLVGLAIGFVFALLFMAVQSAGDIVSYQIGFTMANVIDPSTQTEVSTFARFWMLLATVIFMSLNGHHLLIGAYVDSYQAIPAGQISFDGSFGEAILRISTVVFTIALKIAAPVIVSLVLTDVAMGIVSRMMPSMNVFIMGFSVKVGVGLVVMALALPAFAYVLERSISVLNEELSTVLITLGKA